MLAQQIEQPRIFQPDENWERFVQDFAYNFVKQGFDFAREQADLDYIDAGAFSMVFHCPWDCDKVIKISHEDRHDGDGWLEWAEFCIRHRDAGWEYLPQIYELRVFSSYYLALIERYEETIDDLDVSWRSSSDTIAAACKATYLGKCFGDHFVSDEVAGFAYKSGEMEDYEGDIDEFVSFIIDEWGGAYFGDLHGSNVMFSGDRVVITDPIGGSCGHEATELLYKLGVYVEGYEEEDEQYSITFD